MAKIYYNVEEKCLVGKTLCDIEIDDHQTANTASKDKQSQTKSHAVSSSSSNSSEASDNDEEAKAKEYAQNTNIMNDKSK